MGKTVFIFGAGASASAGAPVMKNFLSKAREILRKETGESDKKRIFSEVSKAIDDLEKVYSKSQLDLENIEEVFSAVEMARMIGRFPNKNTQEEIDKISNNLKMLILMTLQDTIEFPYSTPNGTGGHLEGPVDYNLFANQVLNGCFGKRNISNNVAIITLNYDFALDFALQYHGVDFNYSLNQDNDHKTNSLPLLKLHGSLNWHECLHCESVLPFPENIGDIANPDYVRHQIRHDKVTKQNRGKFPIPFYSYVQSSSKDWECRNCRVKNISSVPFIVPPTWNKAEDQRTIAPVWQRAAKELSEAESIYIIGYSLPETDVFFKYLFAVGTISEEVIERLLVVNIDMTDNVDNRFRKLIGQRVKSKYRYVRQEFSHFIRDFRGHMTS